MTIQYLDPPRTQLSGFTSQSIAVIGEFLFNEEEAGRVPFWHRLPNRSQTAMAMTLADVQADIQAIYGSKDGSRGLDGTFMWFMEEVGELAAALRGGNTDERSGEFADVLAWLVTLANIAGIDLDEAYHAKYGQGCPGCRATPCTCGITEKP